MNRWFGEKERDQQSKCSACMTLTSTKFELKGLEVVTVFLFGSGLVELAVLRSGLGNR